jgi:two-component sensor histidine kinase/HPt (histidine-containing phosphotransfer) domain-containing protein
MKLWSYLFLPREISAFERSYLRRMNRIALIFFYLHVPAFIGVAALAGTSIVQAAILTPIVLIGPTAVYLWLRNPRALAVAFGFTAMVMGGLLVHFGQGPMQIEMHFYFFVLIALLAVFGNPAAIMTAALTVALHHLTLWLVLPSSVFNYEASAWTVVVHAAFVVLESIAAIFVARSFFDNVIGLERIVAVRTQELDHRTREMAMVFDNVEQGFLTVSASGAMSTERSAILRSWLGEPPASGRFADYVAAVDPRFAASFALGWSEAFSGGAPELGFDQLPKRITAGARQLQLSYRAIGEGTVPDAILVVVSDNTGELERERAEAERRELIAAFERATADRKGFVGFCTAADELIRRIEGDEVARGDLPRQLHALKSGAASFGIESVVNPCQALEPQLLDNPGPPSAESRRQLVQTWRAFASRAASLLGRRDVRRLEIADEDVQRALAALRENRPTADVLQTVTWWRLEPIARRFERVAEQGNRRARQVGKAIQIETDDQGLRLDPERWAPFWSTLVHAVNNAIEHGTEDPAERKRSGKPETATISLRAMIEAGALAIEVRDDGRGIDWDQVRARATALGLRAETRDDLVEALFTDGMSTKDTATDRSHRGLGLAALRAAAQLENGKVTIASRPQRGTSLRFEFPLDKLAERDFLTEGQGASDSRRMTG